MHRKRRFKQILTSSEFWWFIGYLQGDGSLDGRNGIWLISTDVEVIDSAKKMINDLFGLESSFYVETSRFPERHKPKLKLIVYSRSLVTWLHDLGLRFGEMKWNVPSLPAEAVLRLSSGALRCCRPGHDGTEQDRADQSCNDHD